jgi:glycosyltransferase involved in cell wall biosynthesis
MRVAFDHQIFALQAYGGISRYFVRLAEELIGMNEAVRVFAPLHCNNYLRDLSQEHLVGTHIKILPAKSIRAFSLLNYYISEHGISRFSPSIMHETYYTPHPVAAHNAARILTVYDMIHERFSDVFPARDKTSIYKRAAVARADHIICISESTKRDLCEMFNVAPERVSVVHLGFETFSEVSLGPKLNFGDKPFLLFVGNRGGYKNFKSLLQAVASCRELRDTFDIFTFGGNYLTSEEQSFIDSLELRPGSVKHFNGGDAVLGQLYRCASALVYPSLYEGFGLPPLEAMAHDCPVVTSNTSSMPEVVGSAGEYFCPEDIDEQAQAICDVVFDKTRKAELIKLGRQRLQHFSWKRCAEETLSIYEGRKGL